MIIHELGVFLSAVFKNFISDVASDNHSGATPSQLRILQLLGHNPGIAVVEAARSLAITTPSACTAVNRLVGLGWVERRTDTQDKRCRRLHLSEAGRELVNEFESTQVSRLKEILARCTDEEIGDFREMVGRLTAYIEERYP